MAPLIASIAAFAFGLLFLPMVFRGMRVKGGTGQTLKAGLVGGVVSVAAAKILWVVLTFIFFPIVLTGAVGAFVVQVLVNLVVLVFVPRLMDGVEFDSMKTTAAAAAALGVLQVVVRMIGS